MISFPVSNRMKALLSSVTAPLTYADAKVTCEDVFRTIRRNWPVTSSPTRLETRNNLAFNITCRKAPHLTPTQKGMIWHRHKRIETIAQREQAILEQGRNTDITYFGQGRLNCGESCQLAIGELKKRKVPFKRLTLEVPQKPSFFSQTHEHSVIVVNIKPTFQLDRPQTHSGQEVLFDPQNGIWTHLRQGLDESLGFFGMPKGAKPTRQYLSMNDTTFYFSQREY
ncbi:MAG: hypothetical protein ACKO37_02685 [Vampirovibrionales bacterium]